MADSEVQLNDFGSLFSLKGKVAVVTGGSRGLGLHAASGLLQAGCSKVYITSRKADACEAACKALNALPNKQPGAQAISVPSDSSKIEGIKQLVADVSKTTDHVDILCTNAGATWGAPLADHTDASFSKVMDLNVKSVFFTIQQFLPLLEKQATKDSPSRVITTASVAGLVIGSTGETSTPSYTASKAAVLHLMRHLCVDLGHKHIGFNSIAPGFFPSKMANYLIQKQGGLEVMSKKVPNRRLGLPDDFAATVVFLASRASGHINGQEIVLDGGARWSSGRL